MKKNKTAIIISCSKSKLSYPAPAGEMYTGKLFQNSLWLANQIGGDIYISSALHGLIKPDVVIEPYDFGILGPIEGGWRDRGLISTETMKSLGRRRRRVRNPIVAKYYKQQLIDSGITNEDYDNTYVAAGEYYIPALEEVVLKRPYYNLQLNSGGFRNLIAKGFWENQLTNINNNDLLLGFSKQHYGSRPSVKSKK